MKALLIAICVVAFGSIVVSFHAPPDRKPAAKAQDTTARAERDAGATVMRTHVW